MLDSLGETALRSFALATIVACVLCLLRIRQSQLLLAAWTVVLLASLAMPALLHLIPVGLRLDPAFPGPLIEGVTDLLQPVTGGDAITAAFPAQFPAQSRAWSWLEVVYAVVCCGILSRVVLGVVLSVRLLARAAPVWPDWAAGQRVRISQDVTGPVTIAHVILLPADAVTWSAETREAVLEHERAHVARWDFAMLMLSQLNRAVFWFSPLSWWLHRRLVTLSELASDDQAMAATRDRLGYAEILLEMGRRSSPAPAGPAMARPSTLAHRIDRILRDQTIPCPASRTHQAVLTTGIVGLSLGVAGLAYGPALEPARAPSTAQWRSSDEFPIMAAPLTPESKSAARPDAGAAAPPLGAETETGMQYHPMHQSTVPSPSQSSTSGITAAQPSRPTTPALRPLPRTAAKTVPASPVLRAPERLNPLTRDLAETSQEAGLQAPGAGRPPAADAGSGVATKPDTPAVVGAPLSPTHQASYGSSSLQNGLEGIAGSTCTGVIAVGLRAAGGTPARPDVVPGQAVPAHAQFFRKEGGALWVRFDAFGRPSLDLPVRFARNGMTWTGEYGIAYTVQAVGGDRLAGLASLVANDSARLSFGCSSSTSRPL